ncbi:hypothetical protein F5Y13DRAFT_199796 [Hypoxylon sp. FL1857]|nr:hypothetical protein F5Y13DRAFT_199796 [Hypoxylon sp. FL1857]
MRSAQILQKAMGLLEGFTFDAVKEFTQNRDNVLLPFIMNAALITPEEARDTIATQINLVFLICVRSEDVYCRLRGNEAFYHLILADWNSMHSAAPFSPLHIEELINLFVIARRRYLADDTATDVKTKLTSSVDHFVKTIDEVDSAVATRRVAGLKAPNNFKSTSIWPPAHFSSFAVAIIAESKTRKELFGIDYKNKGAEDDAPQFPHDQDLPLDVRKFLCHLSLTETAPDSKVALFPAPIAFLTNEQRQEWYLPTGHESRFYTTIDEFSVFAREEFSKPGKDLKQHVMGLLTPWFFEIEAVKPKAAERDEPIPTIWKKTCFKAGLMVCLSKLQRAEEDWSYRLILFKPGRPHYTRAAEPSDRRPKQDAWIRELLNKLDGNFNIIEGWIGGSARTHHAAPPGREVSPDSVEVSNEIITEIMEVPSSLPTTSKEFYERGFKVMDRYRGY